MSCSRCAGPLRQQRCNQDQVASLARRTQAGRRIGSRARVLAKRQWLGLRVGRWSFQERTGLLELVGAVGSGQAVGTDLDQAGREAGWKASANKPSRRDT